MVLYTFFMVIIFEFNILLKAVYLFILYLLVAGTLNKFIKPIKVVILSLLGGLILTISSLISIVSSLDLVLSVLVIMLLGVVLFKPKNFKKAIGISFVSFAYTLLKWGFSYLLQIILFSVCSVSIEGLFLYYFIDLGLTGLLSCVIYISFRVLYQKKLILDFVYNVFIEIGDCYLELKLLLDSGNSLMDDKTGLPVIVVSKEVIEQKLGKKINLSKLRSLAYQTLGGYCSNLFILASENIVIKKQNKLRKVRASIGIVEKNFNLYDGLLHLQTI